jgi:hypothetical protein
MSPVTFSAVATISGTTSTAIWRPIPSPGPAGANLLQQQAKFDAFVEAFNCERPHETMLRANGADIATQAELLRNSQRVALEHYTQAMPESKRAAQARVLTMIFGEDSANGTFRHMAVSPNIN